MLKKIVLSLTVFGLLFACGGSDDGPDSGGVEDNFDRGAMLTHIADNIIIPAFEDFQSQVTTLKSATETFTTSPTEANLESVQTAWFNAYKTWQYVEMFNIGKAEELQFVNFINIYPVTVSDIESNVAEGGYNLDSSNNHDAQGFPAIDYLLYGIGEDATATVAKFTTDANAEGYKTYLTDVVTKIDEVTNEIVADWNGSFRDEFVTSSANTATSSLNKLVNDFIFYYEKGLRANKIGIPGGSFSDDALPGNVEALYNEEVSRELALEGLQAVEDFFNGKSYNSTTIGLGFEAYLEALEREDLITAITNQLNASQAFINTLDTNFYQQTISDSTQMTMAFDELQQLVPYFKVDMLSAFNVSVDFIDADGD